ncbi:MAG: hypothetical protein IPN74_01375 [Haliscomenobacter sp.]|nr:hypothetical protein [Haliscomenobacter sp.]MBK8877235.1 hypothetical protein [Haliscomenobacter sp.]
MKTIPFVLALALSLASCTTGPKPGSDSKTPPPPAQEVFEYICMGTEPFWSVEITAGGIYFSSPEIAKTAYPYKAPKTGDAGAVYETEATISGVKSKLKVTVSPGACSDGMSDTEYPYFSEVVRDGETLKGCAREKD